ncbi:MAG: fibronectin type III domain-containing protein, partial [Actinomycetota bacterium]
ASGAGPTIMFISPSELSNVQAIASGKEHFCAYRDNGVTCWGANDFGQLGDGTLTHPKTFTQVAPSLASSVTIDDPGAKDVSSASFNMTATASSGATVTFAASASPTVCSVTSSGTVTVLGAGNCIVMGSAAIYGLYLASSNSRTLAFAALKPTVTLGDASDVGFTSATVAASVSARGSAATTALRFGTSSDLSTGTDVDLGSQTGIAVQALTKELTSLSPGVTYFYRFTSTNALGSTASAISSFTTKGAKPTVVTGSATAQVFEASVAGEVNANEVDTAVSFEYGTDPLLEKATTVAVSEGVTGATAKAVSVSLAKLAAGTTYYFRTVASNSVGTAKGEIKSFTTRGGKPTTVTGSATRGVSGMTVNGKVNARELESSVRFEYGTDPKLSAAQQTAAKTQTGSDDVDVSAVITGLAENTTYYYRVVASNAVGSSEGDIKTFTTTRPEGVSINDGDEFTSSENVVVSVVGPPTAVRAILSNDGGFKTSESFDLVNNSADIKWKLQSSREGTFTKIVYVKYVSRFGSQSQAQTDDIILDTTKPVMTTATAAAAAPTGSAVTVSRIGAKAKASGGVRLSLRGSDTISGIGTIEVRSAANKPATKVNVSRVAGKADGKPRAASQTATLKTTAKRLQVRVIDRAGNASAWRTITVR